MLSICWGALLWRTKNPDQFAAMAACRRADTYEAESTGTHRYIPASIGYGTNLNTAMVTITAYRGRIPVAWYRRRFSSDRTGPEALYLLGPPEEQIQEALRKRSHEHISNVIGTLRRQVPHIAAA